MPYVFKQIPEMVHAEEANGNHDRYAADVICYQERDLNGSWVSHQLDFVEGFACEQVEVERTCSDHVEEEAEEVGVVVLPDAIVDPAV